MASLRNLSAFPMKTLRPVARLVLAIAFFAPVAAQEKTDANTPLHLLQPDYAVPYGVPESEEIVAVLDRIHGYLTEATPAQLVDADSGAVIEDYATISSTPDLAFAKADFRLTSYEWGVTYAGMLLASEATGNGKYAGYTLDRMVFLAAVRPYLIEWEKSHPGARHPLSQVLHPGALDDAGAMGAAMIKARQSGLETDLDPMIRTYLDHISNRQLRLSDGTLARHRPHRHSLWLDDLFMSVPALARMGDYTGETEYFDDAVKQVTQFAERMFDHDKNLFMHAWIEGMEDHPEFHWARANGWAIMAIVELLEVLPEDHAGRGAVLELLRSHIRGLAACQSPDGFWHQLLDRNDSYLETSATAIFAYCFARAINRGWVDAKAYGPAACLAWNAVATKVNGRGQVEGTCVGTGMAFDPAYYYNRPTSRFAAHGYGPVLLAGAEMIELLKKTHPKMNDSAIQFYDREVETDQPIFSVPE